MFCFKKKRRKKVKLAPLSPRSLFFSAIKNSRIYKYANIFQFEFNCWIEDAFFTIKSLLVVCALQVSNFHLTLIYAEYCTRIGPNLHWMSPILLVGLPLKIQICKRNTKGLHHENSIKVSESAHT